MINAINIIIDEKRPMQNGAEFVEIETDEGKPICIGERISDGNFTKIRIMAEDIIKVGGGWYFRGGAVGGGGGIFEKLIDRHKGRFCKVRMFGVPLSELPAESLRACICVFGDSEKARREDAQAAKDTCGDK